MSTSYRIQVAGHLDPLWSDWLDSLTITHNNDGTTDLTGVVRDGAALYGLLNKLRDLGIILIAVEQCAHAQ